jgi:hypothetical protein
MIAKLKQILLFSLLCLVYVLFSYSFLGDWLYSSIGSVLIVLLGYLIWGNGFLRKIGLPSNLLTIAKSILLAAIIAACSFLILKYIGGKYNIRIGYYNWRDYYHVMFYVLNEEIVLGAILLFALVYKWNIMPVAAAIGLAVFFSVLHFIFYKWIFADSGVLGITTLVTLFLVGFVRNCLILQTGHIGYSWGLHVGWVAIMFGSSHTHLQTNMYLAESDAFNLYLGSTEMLIISAIMAVSILAYWIKKQIQLQVRIQ